jgi:hypothetical protein
MKMALPELTKRQVVTEVSQYCEGRVPPHAQDQVRVRYKIRSNAVTLFEERRAFADPSQWVEIKIAQMRYDPESQQWSLFWSDRNSRWRRYDILHPQKNFDALLSEIDKDPTCIFWG